GVTGIYAGWNNQQVFVPWEELKPEIELKLLWQVRPVPVNSWVELEDLVQIGNHPPPHALGVAQVRLSERGGKRLLLPRNGDDEIEGAQRREGQAVAGHVRGTEDNENPPEIQRVPDESIRAHNLQPLT